MSDARDNALMQALVNTLIQLALVPVRVLGRLPLPISRALLRPLAPLISFAMRRRRQIVDRNLALCFPELEIAARRALRRQHFRQLSDSLAETALAWCRPGRLDSNFGRVLGLEHLRQARSGGHGVLLLTAHATCMELGARLLGEQFGGHAIYRPLRQPSLERFQNKGRGRYAEGMIARNDVRAMVRHLRRGGVLWYAPDQDFGPGRSEFADFFGHATATPTGLVDLARLGRARVVPMYPLKGPDGRITVHIEAAWEDWPGDDMQADLARYNAWVELWVRAHPAQYWWMHRRFKTSPGGQGDRYA